ncbi:MAG: CHAT domain-containing protein [Saprospiraceae bacterium]
MRKAPLFLAAFANSNDAWLDSLSKEEGQLRNTLGPLHDQRQIEFLSIGSTSVDDIYKNFNRFHNRIIAFHFAGHSSASLLELVGQNHRAANLALLMGMQDNLHLVVLNGCANKEQVEGLLKAGVKVVVATSSAINDTWAAVFSGQFYEALKSGKTIAQAFDTALSYLEEKNQFDRTQARMRGIAFRMDQEPPLPWGLYGASEDDLNWTLPQETFSKEAVADFREYQEEVPIGHLNAVNQELVIAAADGLAPYQPDIAAILPIYRQTPNPAFFNTLQNLVIDKFPSTISIQIRDLFTPDACASGRLRLKELNEVFLAVTQLLAAMAMANLWEEIRDQTSLKPKEGFIIQPQYKKDLLEYLYLDKEKAKYFDYIWLLATVQRILEENNAAPFLPEMAAIAELLKQDKTIFNAYQFIEQQLRQPLVRQEIKKDEVEKLCMDAEKQLGILLKTCGFLSAYEFVSVKDISVRKQRNSPEPAFIHEKAILRGRDLLILDKMPVYRKQFTNDRSVLVTRSLSDQKDPTYCLSPFLIDLNAFSLKGHALPRLFIFHHRDGQNGLVYQDTQIMDQFFTVDQAYNRLEFHELELLQELMGMFEKDLNL